MLYRHLKKMDTSGTSKQNIDIFDPRPQTYRKSFQEAKQDMQEINVRHDTILDMIDIQSEIH